ncbi:Endonuclease/exonuclease/phosphatase [Trema orientale]|uniref:Endonuclease/exonuclease/phosphatase n=1 Tax=Trema orientale TaxID=63057 RepID=A0A2P5ELV5_TREOI|nr:Endonuclease/exonuclease/phosphatase [Trema orientale]
MASEYSKTNLSQAFTKEIGSGESSIKEQILISPPSFSIGYEDSVTTTPPRANWKKRARDKGKSPSSQTTGTRNGDDRPKGVSMVAMVILAWNCRGLARSLAVQNLRALAYKFKPDVMILSELMISEERTRERMRQLHFFNICFVPAKGRSGGFCLCWRDGVELEPHFMSKNIIAAVVYSDPPNTPWSLSAIYGPPAAASRREFWHSIPGLLARTTPSKLLMGDFNSVMHDYETWSSARGVGGSASSLGGHEGLFLWNGFS